MPTGTTLATCTTTADGTCTLPGKALVEGEPWCWTEDHAPAGYVGAEGGCLEGDAVTAGTDATIAIDVTEASSLVVVTVTKHDALSVRTPVPDAMFALWGCPNAAGSTEGCARLAEATTDKNGLGTFPPQLPSAPPGAPPRNEHRLDGPRIRRRIAPPHPRPPQPISGRSTSRSRSSVNRSTSPSARPRPLTPPSA